MEPEAGMVALWAARVEDLQFAPTVDVECAACRHSTEIAVEAIKTKLPGWYPVLDLHLKVRCERCRAKGRAIIDARRALGLISY